MLVHNYRITPPACAGKTTGPSLIVLDEWDHPRMCGKDKTTMAILLLPLGSPLHVRERLILTFHRNLLIGITPACAGKTRIGIEGSVARGDHPRMCGKDLSFLKIQFSCRGSPPHVRERLYPDHSCILCGRITPACAGKTVADGEAGPEI